MPKAIRRVRSALVLTTSLIAVAGLPSQVWAQETAPSAKAASAEDKSGTDSPDIVVTATRRELRLQDVPLSISAVDGERLSELGARDAQDYVLTIPGVSFTDASGGRQTFVVRGIAPLGSGATTAVYLDETPLDIDLRLFDIARVEVLRGPQGTLYGQSSMGGAIRTITNRPDSTGFAAAVDASINSVHRGGAGGDVNVMVNVPLVTDKLAVRGVYYHEREAGFVDNYAVLDRIPGEVRDPSSAPVTPTTLIKKNRGAHDIDGARLMVQFDPVERLSISGTYLWQKDHYNGLNSEDTDIGRGRLIQSRAFDEIWGTEVQQYNLTARYDAGFAELMSSTTWNRGTGRTARDVTYVFGPIFAGAYEALVNDGRDPADVLGAPSVNERAQSHQFTQELRLTSQGDGPVGWVIGGYYNNFHTRGLQTVESPGFADALGPLAPLVLAGSGDEALIFLPNHYAEELSGFGELTYKVTDRLGLTAGMRHYWVKSSFDDFTDAPLFGIDEKRDAAGASESGNTFKFGLDYKLADNVLLYAVAASGYRAGGANGAVPPGGTPEIPKTFKSDTLWQYELGFRSHFLGNRIVINGAIYRTDWDKIQLGQNDNQGFSGTFNAGKARVSGAELELQVKPSNSLTISSTTSFTDAEFLESFGAFRAGENIPNIPELSASLVARYETPVFGDWTGFLQGAATYVGNRYTYLGDEVERQRFVLEDYTKVDLRIGVTSGPYEVALFANNLFDARGQIGREDNLGYERLQYIPPRTIGLNVKAGF